MSSVWLDELLLCRRFIWTEVVIEQQNADERLKDIFKRLMELYERHAQEQ